MIYIKIVSYSHPLKDRKNVLGACGILTTIEILSALTMGHADLFPIHEQLR